MTGKIEVPDRKEYFTNYRQNNSEQIRLYNIDYYARNKKLIRERQKAYYLNMKSKMLCKKIHLKNF